MPPSNDAILAELWQSAYYRDRIALIEKLRPLIPSFQYKGESNIEEIKFKLAQQQMFDAIIALLKPLEK